MKAESVFALVEAASFERARPLPVSRIEDRFAAAAQAGALAARIGFERAAILAAGLVACELAENAVRHAGGGELEVSAAPGAGLLRIRATDRGPGLRNVELALEDGCTDEGPLLPEQLGGRIGFGSGLGSVRRLADALLIEQGGEFHSVTAFLLGGGGSCRAACPVRVRRGAARS